MNLILSKAERHRQTQETPAAHPPALPRWQRALLATLKGALALALLVAGGLAAQHLMATGPDPSRTPPERRARLVTVETVAPALAGPTIEAWGVVEAHRRLILAPEIGGRIEWISPALVPGGVVTAGEELIRLDARDYALALAEAEARVAEIEARILIEAGQQERARRDLARSPVREGLTQSQRALILRAPQRAELEAQRAAALAQRDRARLDRDRTTLRAPFDALVETEEAALGARLGAGQQVAALVAAERYRLTLALPPTALSWIDLQTQAVGQSVRLTQPGVWPEGTVREGRIARLDPGLSEQGRMARLIVEIDDPLAREGDVPRLLLGSYLRAEIAARPLPGAIALDRAWLREGDRVWVMAEDDRLQIRPVEIAWRGVERVLVSDGLAPGERIVTTAIASVAEGMALRTPEPEALAATEAGG
ncbi:MAG: efflux RND transporter periplasmic adaptor subunit [Pseudomonadota bacterium]